MDRMAWTAAARWYCLVVALFLGVRAVTTPAAGASFALPGAGWRAVWQLLLVAILVFGLARPRAQWIAVATVGAVYLLATALELVHGSDLLGIVPVDMRDRVVHPLPAVLAPAGLAADLSRASLRDRVLR